MNKQKIKMTKNPTDLAAVVVWWLQHDLIQQQQMKTRVGTQLAGKRVRLQSDKMFCAVRRELT